MQRKLRTEMETHDDPKGDWKCLDTALEVTVFVGCGTKGSGECPKRILKEICKKCYYSVIPDGIFELSRLRGFKVKQLIVYQNLQLLKSPPVLEGNK